MVKKESIVQRLWWMSVIAGILLILFGIAALFWPGLTLAIFVVLFSVLMVAWGIIVIVDAFSSMKYDNLWWLELVFGILALIAGVVLIKNPALSFSTIIIITAAAFIVRGLVDIVGSLFGTRRRTTSGIRAVSVVLGVLGVIAGIVTLAYPVASGVAFTWVAGLYALIVGALMVSVAVMERDEVEKLVK